MVIHFRIALLAIFSRGGSRETKIYLGASNRAIHSQTRQRLERIKP